MVKKTFLALAALLASLPAFSKYDAEKGAYTHSVYADYGASSIFSIFNPDLSYYPYDDISNQRYTGVFNLGYEYRLGRRFGIGADISWGGKTYTMTGYDEITKKVLYVEDHRETILSIMVTFRWIWLDRELVSLYSAGKLGYSHCTYDKIETMMEWRSFLPYFHVVPIGIELGRGHVRGFAELGLGAQACVAGGIKYRF